MLNIEKYKEMLIDMEIIDVNKLAVVNDKPVNCTDVMNVILEKRKIVRHI